MKPLKILPFVALALVAIAGHATDVDTKKGGSKPATRSKSVCKKGELGGVVASNKKQADGGYVTKYVGSKVEYSFPAEKDLTAADKHLYAERAALKPGDIKCFADDGS